MAFRLSRMLDVSEGVQPDQFSVGEREEIDALEDLDSIYRQLLDEPVTAVLSVIGGDGRPNLTPVWFAYDGDHVILNFAEHRKKTEWVRREPRVTIL